jgi:hypothetical protein
MMLGPSILELLDTEGNREACAGMSRMKGTITGGVFS